MYEEQGDQEKALQVLLIVGWLFGDLMERVSQIKHNSFVIGLLLISFHLTL